MASGLIAIFCVILLMATSGDHYRRGRSVLEKRIEDVYWQSSTSCLRSHNCLNRSLRSWITAASQKTRQACTSVFEFDRWGCRVEKKIFDKVSRESAALYALLSSSLAHQAATTLALMGSMKRRLTNGYPEEGHLPANIVKQSLHMTSRYLNIRNLPTIKDLHYQARRHNAIFGLKTLKQSISKTCKCHGFSGSCSLKTCWDTLPPFSLIAHKVRMKYLTVVKVKQENRPRRGLAPLKDTISVLDESDDFCSHLTGRRCQDSTHCKMFCCDRGFFNMTGTEYFYCNCSWNHNYELNCKICSMKVEHIYCQ